MGPGNEYTLYAFARLTKLETESGVPNEARSIISTLTSALPPTISRDKVYFGVFESRTGSFLVYSTGGKGEPDHHYVVKMIPPFGRRVVDLNCDITKVDDKDLSTIAASSKLPLDFLTHLRNLLSYTPEP